MKKFLKYLWRILVGIFALIGLLAVGLLWYLYSQGCDIQIVNREDQLAERAELLKQSSFSPDTVQYHFTVVQDSARAQEIRDYFKLDTLYSPDATTWEKAVAISKFVAKTFRMMSQTVCLIIPMPLICGSTRGMLIQVSTAVCMPSLIMSCCRRPD